MVSNYLGKLRNQKVVSQFELFLLSSVSCYSHGPRLLVTKLIQMLYQIQLTALLTAALIYQVQLTFKRSYSFLSLHVLFNAVILHGLTLYTHLILLIVQHV